MGEAKDRSQCLDWVSRVKNVCDQSGRSFRQELINKSGILVQNFIRSLSENITNKELTEKILQFFSDVPTTSHALNKLRLIRQGVEEPIVNYNQRYQNLVERVEGCQLDSIRSTVAMELYLGSIIEPIRKSIRNTLYFNSKHAPKTLGEAMQKAQDLHIKHLYAIGEDQDSVTNSSDVLPEITVNEVTSREDRGWYRNKRDFREGRSKNFLHHRLAFRILPHRSYTGIQSQISICRANGEMAVQTYTVRTQSGPSLFPIANRPGVDGLQRFRNGLSGRHHNFQ